MEVHLSYKEGFLIVTKREKNKIYSDMSYERGYKDELEMGMKWGNLIYSE